MSKNEPKTLAAIKIKATPFWRELILVSILLLAFIAAIAGFAFLQVVVCQKDYPHMDWRKCLDGAEIRAGRI